MRKAWILAWVGVAACSPVEVPKQTATAPTVTAPASDAAVASLPTVAAQPPADPSPLRAPRFVRTNLGGIEVEAVVFDSRSHRLVVADQKGGPGSQWPDARGAGRAKGGIAAVNAGFFTPEGEPLGRVVVEGDARGGVNRASSLGAGFFVEREGSLRLVRREAFAGGREALQSGPFLVEGGRSVGGLSARSSSARTFVATDGASAWVLARTGPCSLQQLGHELAGARVGGVRLQTVLNLDGGRSSELWVSDRIPGGPVFVRPFWNKPVRNFLVLRPREID